MRKRFWFEVIVGGSGLVLFIVTLISREWIEIVFGVDPDGGSGTLEMVIALGLLCIAAASFVLARREYMRPRAAFAAPSSG
jgi:hypothetical protein